VKECSRPPRSIGAGGARFRPWGWALLAFWTSGATGGEQLQLDLPIHGWSSAASTQVVVSHARPDAPVELFWQGWSWLLWPNQAGRAGAFLPILPRSNLFEVEQAGRGKAAVQLLGVGRGPDLVLAADWDPGARLDLRVVGPDGEPCDSSNRRTQAGGVRLRDDPEAPGPHVFELPEGVIGEYRVEIVCGRLPASHSVRVRALALLQVGTPAEERRELSTVITRCDEVAVLGTVELIGRGQ
jgi:hypothetical protein